MALTIDEVRQIALLARLRLTPEEEEMFVRQLGRVVEYIDQLGSFPAAEEPPSDLLESAEAEDAVEPGLPRERFLANVPETLDGFLVVPEVKKDG